MGYIDTFLEQQLLRLYKVADYCTLCACTHYLICAFLHPLTRCFDVFGWKKTIILGENWTLLSPIFPICNPLLILYSFNSNKSSRSSRVLPTVVDIFVCIFGANFEKTIQFATV